MNSSVVHVRLRGSGTLAEMLCGAHKYGEAAKMASLAVPDSLLAITCNNCRRLHGR